MPPLLGDEISIDKAPTSVDSPSSILDLGVKMGMSYDEGMKFSPFSAGIYSVRKL